MTIMDVKQALLDKRFRESLPEKLSSDIDKFLKNPNCACNHPIYRKIVAEVPDLLNQYYPDKNTDRLNDEINKANQNDWHVINCSVHELQNKLRELPPGRKQLDVARWEDQVTVIVNNLEIDF